MPKTRTQPLLSPQDVCAVVIAAGQGTRMKSDLPKMLHPICGQPMLFHALEAAKRAAARGETPAAQRQPALVGE